MGRDNFKKHNLILENREDIIRKYNRHTSMKEIAKLYGVTTGCISLNLKLWGIRKKHGVKFLMREIARGL